MKDYKIKQSEYKKCIEILVQLIEIHSFNANVKNLLVKKHLESLRCCIELIEENIPCLDPNY